MIITAGMKNFDELNREIRTCEDSEIDLRDVMGQRYIGAGLKGKHIMIHGIPGNALCAYLDNCDV